MIDRCLYFIAWNRVFTQHRNEIAKLTDDQQRAAKARVREEAARVAGVPEKDIANFVDEVRDEHG